METPTRIVTLVHGTFASEAAWIKPDSLFRYQLSKELGGTVIFQPFVWTGANSHHARAKAASELSLLLKKQIDDYPNANHYIIAHSHGGNVALYAMRDNTIGQHIKSIICLATPFIHSAKRDTTISAQIVSWLGSGLATSLVIAGLTLPFFNDFLLYEGPEWSIYVLSALWLIGFLVLPFLAFNLVHGWIYNSVDRYFSNIQQDLYEKICLPKIQSCRLYTFRYASDEAFRFLYVISNIAEIPFLIFLILFVTFQLLIEFASEIEGSENPFLLLPGYAVLFAFSILMIPLWLVMIALHYVLLSHKAGFGQKILQGLLLRVSVRQDLPQEVATAEKLEFRLFDLINRIGVKKFLTFRLRFGLLHSLVYREPTIISQMAIIFKRDTF